MLKQNPLVSVVMSCYNSQETVKESVDSILSQTVDSLEFIIIDDASTDNTLSILKSYEDSRIVLIHNENNMGLGYNLNYGMRIAKGRYIARMDSDDISLPNRFERQIDYLNGHPELMCIGTRAIRFGNIPLKSRLFKRIMKQPLSYDDLKIQMLNGTPLLHPSVMFNGDMFRHSGMNYDPNYKRAQDYELWSRMIWDYKFENIPDCLLRYRYSITQASVKHHKDQVLNSFVIYKRVLEKLFDTGVDDTDVNVHLLFSTTVSFSADDFKMVSEWLDRLHNAVVSSPSFDEHSFNSYFSYRWAVICSHSIKNRCARLRAFIGKKYLRRSIECFLRLLF